MLSRLILLSFLTLTLGAAVPSAFAVTTEEFKAVYDSLQRQTLDRSGEVAEIDSFTYVKDVATFRFGKGTMLLQRPVHGRPTLALFVGTGNMHVDIPPKVERRVLEVLTKDSLVDKDFSVCLIRIGDDFDLAIKSHFQFQQGRMPVADYEKIRNAKLETYFAPHVDDTYDNLAQLTISIFERCSDGMFWACVGNTFFSFNPRMPEQVRIGYSNEPFVSVGTGQVGFQRRDRDLYAANQLSDIVYPYQVLSINSDIRFSGANGWSVDAAAITVALRNIIDSTTFLSLSLDPHILTDSVIVNGQPINVFRRKDMIQTVCMLPRTARSSDSLSIVIWSHDVGDNYQSLIPLIESPAVFPIMLHLTFPKGYNYALPHRGPTTPAAKGWEQCTAGPLVCRQLWYQPLVTGWDTTEVTIGDSLTLTFVARFPDRYLRDDDGKEVLNAFRYFYDNYGMPSGFSQWYVFGGGSGVAPGLIRVDRRNGDPMQSGGIYQILASQIAAAWFGPMVKPLSYRDAWLIPAMQAELALLYTQKMAGADVMYTTLSNERDEYFRRVSKDYDLPLAIGFRAGWYNAQGKGLWLLHMLRVLMFDLQTMKDDSFSGFLRDVIQKAHEGTLSNAELCKLAEQRAGMSLDWFFDPWLYGSGAPTFEGSWKTSNDGSGFYIDLDLVTTGVSSEFVYPMLIHVYLNDRSALVRQPLSASKQHYRIGPFAAQPTDLKFNEYESVLCKSKVRKL